MDLYPRVTITLGGFLFFLVTVKSVFAFDVRGSIYLAPPYPKLEIIQVNEKYQNACGKEYASESLVVSPEGRVQNVVIFLDGNLPQEAHQNVPVMLIDQKNCNFEPHVLVVRQGTPFLVSNSEYKATSW